MATYNRPTVLATVALDAVTPVKLFATPTTGRRGWRVINTAAVVCHTLVLPVSTAAPTFAQMVTAAKSQYKTAAGAMQADEAGDQSDVWACLASSTGDVYAEELI